MYHAACKVEFQPFKRSYSDDVFKLFTKLLNVATHHALLGAFRYTSKYDVVINYYDVVINYYYARKSPY